jgi:hypothetical protein
MGQRWGAEDGSAMTGSFFSPPIAALGGVRLTLSQLPTEYKSENNKQLWGPKRFQGLLVDRLAPWEDGDDGEYFFTHRKSHFQRHYPQRQHVSTLPDDFTTRLESIQFYRDRRTRGHRLAASYTAKPWISPPVLRHVDPAFSDLSGTLEGATDANSLKLSQQSVAGIRFMGSRGDRIINGWQAGDRQRGLAFGAFARHARKHRDYREIAFRLWSRYYLALTGADLAQAIRNDGRMTVDYPEPAVRSRDTGANAAITFIHAAAPAVVPAVNPEAPMWTDAAQAGLTNGTKQFVDAQDLSEDELIELLSAIDRSGQNNVSSFSHQLPGPHTPGGTVPLAWFNNGTSRFYYPNGIDEIFVHMGADANRFDARAQARIIASIHRAPSALDISSVIRVLATRHGVGDDLLFGLEAVMYRNTVYRSDRVPGARQPAPRYEYFNADGNVELHLPRTYTASAYFDTFLNPEPVPLDIDAALELKTQELIHNSSLLAHFRGVSLAWAAFSLTMIGRHWANRPTAEPNRRIRQWISIITRTFNFDKITDWSTVHTNAMAIQYGFVPSPSVRSTEAGFIHNYWNDWQTPTLTNHYLELWGMEFMPTFQILPYFDPETGGSHPTWPEDLPHPITARESFQGRVWLGRDRPPFAPQAWKSDGGFMKNSQFYAAAGSGGNYRFQGHTLNFEIARWRVGRVDDFPGTVAGFAPTWMEPAGPGHDFSDFLLPGSIIPYNFSQNCQYTFGVRLLDPPAGVSYEKQLDRWHDSAKQQPHNSLMINYVHPTRDRRQLDDMLDYSTLILGRGNVYSGMVLVRHLLPDLEVDSRFDPSYPEVKQVPIITPTAHPTPLYESKPTRVARSYGQPGGSYAKPKTQARMDYVSKYPDTKDQVPPLEQHSATVSPEGITLDERPGQLPEEKCDPPFERYEPPVLPEAASGYDADLEAARAREMDADFQAFMAQQAVKQAAFKAARAEADANIQRRVQEAAAKARAQQSSKAKVPPSATAAKPGVKWQVPVSGRFPVKPAGPVEPNDSAAGSSQAAAQRQADILNAAKPPLSQPPRSQTGGKRTVHFESPTNPFDALNMPTTATEGEPLPPGGKTPHPGKMPAHNTTRTTGPADTFSSDMADATAAAAHRSEAVNNDGAAAESSRSAEN